MAGHIQKNVRISSFQVILKLFYVNQMGVYKKMQCLFPEKVDFREYSAAFFLSMPLEWDFTVKFEM